METPLKLPPKVSKEYLTETQFLFHCHIKIKIDIDLGEQYLDECFNILKMVDKQYNSYSNGSYFDLINKNAGSWVEVDTDAIKMLEQILEIQMLTDGIYNIGITPLLKLWGFYDPELNNIPSAKNIDKVLSEIKGSCIEIEGNNVRIGKKAEIITGSFIKAFAVDKAICFLKSEGVSDAIINAGGSSIYGLNNDEHPFWTINIPHAKEDGYRKFYLSNECLSLSGKKNNFIELEGKKYGHVINAKTGLPSKNFQAMTLTSTSFLGDILSTFLMANDSSNPILNNSILQKYDQFVSFYYVIS